MQLMVRLTKLTSFDGGRGLDQTKSAIEDFEVFNSSIIQAVDPPGLILKVIEACQSDRML